MIWDRNGAITARPTNFPELFRERDDAR